MVVCKYFLQGNCRYAQNCKFEHIYSSKYSYHANPPQQQSTGVTDAQLVNQVQTDIQAVLNGRQWILSCYAPFKEKPLFPGIQDLSQEEARLFIYQAKANNNLDQAIIYTNNLVKEAHRKYERLLQPDATIIKVLRSLYKGETVASPFSNIDNSFGNNASSIFRNAVQSPSLNNTNSIFNQSQNSNPKDIFSKANENVFAQKAFVNNQEIDAKSIFSQANQNVFQQNTQTQNVFQQNTQIPNVFQQNTQTQNVFQQNTQNVFERGNQNIEAPTDIFAEANKSFFGNDKQTPFTAQENVFQKSGIKSTNDKEDDVIYSKMEDLKAEELDAFKSDSFKLGFIPEIAPPKELCTNNKGFNYF